MSDMSQLNPQILAILQQMLPKAMGSAQPSASPGGGMIPPNNAGINSGQTPIPGGGGQDGLSSPQPGNLIGPSPQQGSTMPVSNPMSWEKAGAGNFMPSGGSKGGASGGGMDAAMGKMITGMMGG